MKSATRCASWREYSQVQALKTKRLLQRWKGVSVAQFVRAAVELEKEQQIKASFETFFAVFDRQSIASIAVLTG
jgi:hypothetical protein